MRKLIILFLSSLLFICTTCSLTSCDDDYWEDHEMDFYNSIEGHWIIVSTQGKDCPYFSRDEWYFYNNGDFEAYGFDDLTLEEFREFGRWNRRDYDFIKVRLEGQNRSLEIIVDRMDRYGMILNVRDILYTENHEDVLKYQLYLERISSPWPRNTKDSSFINSRRS